MKQKKLSYIPFLLAFLFSFQIALAQTSSPVLPTASAEEVGMSSDRLARADQLLTTWTDSLWVPGAVALVARRGKVVLHENYGWNEIEKREPMEIDAIFRMASMTKPVASVALMMLYEEGHFLLDDPVEKYIPEFKGAQVLVSLDTETGDYETEPANSKPTIRQLFTHTSGIGYGFIHRKAGYFYSEAGIPDAFVLEDKVLAEEMKKLATMPLLHHPGEKFTYGLNVDMIGYLVEIFSGQSLAEFMETRIFARLGMEDTYFYLPDEKADRLVNVYSEPKRGELIVNNRGKDDLRYNFPIHGAKTYFSGGSGLVSTAKDFFLFSQMLLNGGELNGVRILSPKTIDLMTANQIGDLTRSRKYQDKFGLGFSVATEETAAIYLASAGRYGWTGYFKTLFWVDPQEEVVGVLLTQMNPSKYENLFEKFEILVNQAIEE